MEPRLVWINCLSNKVTIRKSLVSTIRHRIMDVVLIEQHYKNTSVENSHVTAFFNCHSWWSRNHLARANE
ncbi:hypothetical protein VCR20J5_160012 [Vibrio crassostreae]|nr:hypothetical protein VCR15J5_110123 [Vibrio crassostreae]CDT23748.1 hypothetical protein VCR20J5_160012 [Vibrio crassostreae]